MSRQPSYRHLALLLASALAATAACIPVHVTYRDSPPLVGYYRAVDGSPVRGAVAAVNNRFEGRSCTKSATQDTTDAHGIFRLPETEHVENMILLIPMDRIRGYQICVAVNGVPELAYVGGQWGTAAKPAIVYCFQWEASDGLRASCVDSRPWGARRADHWSANGMEGHYRALDIFDHVTGGTPHVLVQWVVGDADSISAPVAATLDLNRLASMNKLTLTGIGTAGGTMQLQAQGIPPGEKRAQHQLVFQLGAPGEARLLSDECSWKRLDRLTTGKKGC